VRLDFGLWAKSRRLPSIAKPGRRAFASPGAKGVTEDAAPFQGRRSFVS